MPVVSMADFMDRGKDRGYDIVLQVLGRHPDIVFADNVRERVLRLILVAPAGIEAQIRQNDTVHVLLLLLHIIRLLQEAVIDLLCFRHFPDQRYQTLPDTVEEGIVFLHCHSRFVIIQHLIIHACAAVPAGIHLLRSFYDFLQHRLKDGIVFCILRPVPYLIRFRCQLCVGNKHFLRHDQNMLDLFVHQLDLTPFVRVNVLCQQLPADFHHMQVRLNGEHFPCQIRRALITVSGTALRCQGLFVYTDQAQCHLVGRELQHPFIEFFQQFFFHDCFSCH